MLVKNQKRDRPCIMSNNEPFECVESFKYPKLEVPSNHKWNKCTIRRFEAAKRAYYVFKNTCDYGDIKCWILKKYLFDTLMIPVSLSFACVCRSNGTARALERETEGVRMLKIRLVQWLV